MKPGLVQLATESALEAPHLRQTDDRTHYALRVAGIGTWEAELVAGHVEWSETMYRLMGRAAGEFDGTIDGFKSLVAVEDHDKFSSIVHGNFDDQRDFQCDLRVSWPDGARHWVQLRGRVRGNDDGTIRLLGVAQDITEYKELELKLRQSHKMEAMGRLAGGVAHDFNNILTAILGYAALIESEPVDDESTRSHAGQIRQAAERAAALTRQLLAFSRRQVIERRVVSVSEVVTELIPMLTQILGEQIRVERALDSALDPVFADRGQIEQLVLNLAVNGRDAMPKGGLLKIATSNVTLGQSSFCSRHKLAKGDYVLLTIADTGTGMDECTRGQIFEPFFTTKEAGHGTGLGLSTVFEIVKTMGGAIRVSSAPGEGTTFSIYLPKTSADMLEATRRPPSTTGVIGGHETVLLVEDEEPVRTLMAGILERNGYSVLSAGEADTARRIAAESDERIHLVLADVMMPDGTGPDLVATLQTKHAGPRALYMSGYAGAVLARQGRLAADSAFLQKPFTGPQLLSKMRQILDAPAA